MKKTHKKEKKTIKKKTKRNINKNKKTNKNTKKYRKTNIKLFNDVSKSFNIINDYQSKNIHRGDNESRVKYYESFSNGENMFIYFYILKKQKDSNVNNLCLPKNKLYYDYINHKFESSLNITNYTIFHLTIFLIYDKKEIIAPKNFKQSILNCNNRFIYISCNIQWGVNKWDGAHQTVLLFDNKKNTVELFDPEYDEKDNIKYDDTVKKFINEQFSNKFKYIGTLETTNPTKLYGPQISVDAYSGLCVTWCILYILNRLSKPDKHPSEVVLDMMKGDNNNRKEKLLKFAKQIKTTIKNNSNMVTTQII